MAESGVWPDRRVIDLLGFELPILQAPMAGAQGSDLTTAVSEAGGLGALPCAMLSPEQIRKEIAAIRAATSRPFVLNFFCHRSPEPSVEREEAWRARLKPYYEELGIDQSAIPAGASRRPFDAAACDLVEELRPSVVSFHFGLPEESLLDRVRSTGAKILASATTVAEARWLDARGCDLVIAQGAEAGGHRGTFLAADVATQVGTMALVPQVVDAVSVPVVAAGGIADGRGIAAALALGASAVLIGTAYLRCPEARISDVHRRALEEISDDGTAITNVFSGRPRTRDRQPAGAGGWPCVGGRPRVPARGNGHRSASRRLRGNGLTRFRPDVGGSGGPSWTSDACRGVDAPASGRDPPYAQIYDVKITHPREAICSPDSPICRTKKPIYPPLSLNLPAFP